MRVRYCLGVNIECVTLVALVYESIYGILTSRIPLLYTFEGLTDLT